MMLSELIEADRFYAFGDDCVGGVDCPADAHHFVTPGCLTRYDIIAQHLFGVQSGIIPGDTAQVIYEMAEHWLGTRRVNGEIVVDCSGDRS